MKKLLVAATLLVVGALGGVGATLLAQPTSQPSQQAQTELPGGPSPVLSLTWSVVKDHPTQAEITACGSWVPVTLYTRAGGETVSQDACDPNRDARAINDALVGALVG